MIGNNKVISMIGIAQKAGKLVSGEFSTEQAVKNGNAKLVIVAEDASDNTKKLFSDKCKFYNVPLIFYSSKENLGKVIGKKFRASIGIVDEGIARSIEKYVQEG